MAGAKITQIPNSILSEIIPITGFNSAGRRNITVSEPAINMENPNLEISNGRSGERKLEYIS
jgi:hypothetical protein